MQLSPETSRLLAELKTFSGGKLTRSDDLGVLLELGRGAPLHPVLEQLSFVAKFVSRTRGIMTRIGSGAEGYDKLATEFNNGIANSSALAQELLAVAPVDVRARFDSTYFALTQETLSNLLSLLYDLSWYKNWLIDHHRG